MEDNVTIVEDGGFMSGDVGIRQVFLEQFRRVNTKGSEETISIVNRMAFISSVKMFEINLLPYILQEKDIKENLNNNTKKIAEIEDDITITKQKYISNTIRMKDNTQYNNYIDYATERLVKLYRERMGILSLMYNRMDYLESGGASGG